MKKSVPSAASKKLPNAPQRNTAKSGTADVAVAGAQKNPCPPKSKAGNRSSLPPASPLNETKAPSRGCDNLPPLAHGKSEEDGVLERQTNDATELVALLDSVEEATAGHTSSSSTAQPSTTTTSGSSAPSSPAGSTARKRGSLKTSPKCAERKSRTVGELTEGNACPGEGIANREDDDNMEPTEGMSLGTSAAQNISPKSKASGKKEAKCRRTKSEISSKKELPPLNVDDEEAVPDQAAPGFSDAVCLDEALKAVEGATDSSLPSSPVSPAAKQKTKKELERQYADGTKQIRDLSLGNERLREDLEAKTRQIEDLTQRLRSTDKDLQQYTSYTEEINKAHSDSARMMTDASTRLAKKADERAAKAQQQIEKMQKELESVEVHARKMETQAAEQKAAFLKSKGRKVSGPKDSAHKAAGAEIATQESKVPGRRKSGGGSEAEIAEPPQPSTEELQAKLAEFETREARATGRVEVDNERSLILQEKLSQAEVRLRDAEERIRKLEAVRARRSMDNSADNDLPASALKSLDSKKSQDKPDQNRSWKTSISEKISKFKSPSLANMSNVSRRFSRTSRTSKATRFSTQVEFGQAASVDIGNQARMSTLQLGDDIGIASTTTGTGRLPALPAAMRTRSIGSTRAKSDKGKDRKSGRWSMLESAKSALGMKKPEETPIKEIQPAVMPEASGNAAEADIAAVGSMASVGTEGTSAGRRGGSMEHRKSVTEKIKSSLPGIKNLWNKKSGSMSSEVDIEAR